MKLLHNISVITPVQFEYEVLASSLIILMAEDSKTDLRRVNNNNKCINMLIFYHTVIDFKWKYNVIKGFVSWNNNIFVTKYWQFFVLELIEVNPSRITNLLKGKVLVVKREGSNTFFIKKKWGISFNSGETFHGSDTVFFYIQMYKYE